MVPFELKTEAVDLVQLHKESLRLFEDTVGLVMWLLNL